MADVIYANLIVKTREAKLLGAERESRIVDASLADCYKTLSELGLTETDADALATVGAKRLLSLMRELAVSDELFDVLAARFLFSDAKAHYKSLYTEAVSSSVYGFDAYPDYAELIAQREYGDLPTELAAALKLLDKRHGESVPSSQEIDTVIDRAESAYVQRKLKKIRSRTVRTYYRTEYELTNLLIAFRLRLAGKTRADFRALALPVGEDAFDPSVFIECADADISRLAADSPYRAFVTQMQTELESGEGLGGAEKRAEEQLIAIARENADELFTIEPLFAYYVTMLAELKNIRIVLSLKRRGIGAEAIRKRMRTIYV